MMLINIKPDSQELYKSEYSKNTLYKNNKLSELKSRNTFSLNLNLNENLQMIFTNKDLTDDTSNNLIFSPVQFELNEKKNFFEITNKKLLKVQWNKFKEKNRNGKNNTFLFLYERLYFKMDFGMEYDLLSNGSHLPFFVNIYNKELEVGTVIDGMSWVHAPLGLPLKIEYVVELINDMDLTLRGTVSLDEDTLTKLIADKQFQQKAKPYHYTKNFTILSDIKSVYNARTGYLKYSTLSLTISGVEEEVNESVSSSISFL